jgi:hypothetical protein
MALRSQVCKDLVVFSDGVKFIWLFNFLINILVVYEREATEKSPQRISASLATDS